MTSSASRCSFTTMARRRHRKGACCAGQDIHDARNVAERIGIPHYVLDYESRFREVGDRPFRRELCRSARRRCPASSATGRSSSAICSSTARELGAKVLATGHYVASRRRADGSRALYARARRGARPELFPVRDHARAARRSALSARRHDQGRRRASWRARFGLAVADKQDSQDICFVPTGRYTDIIERLKPGAVEPGDIVDLDGRVLGRHQGIIHFTVGQRKGLGIAAGAPLYVVRLDAASRRVVVGPREALRMRPHRAARRQLDRRRRARATCSSDGREMFVQGALDAPAAAGLAARAPRAAMRSNWSTARTACRPARPACSTMRRRGRRACSAAASSRARPPHARGRAQRRARACRGDAGG